MPFWEVALAGGAACLGTGLLCGFLNGAMVTALRIHPFIITLGTMAIYRGVAFVITHGQAITPFPPQLQGIVRWDIGPALHLGSGLFPIPLGIMVLVAVAGTILLNHTVMGREIYAVGDNRVAAICTGLRVSRITIVVFTLAGGLAALSSLIFLGYYGSASSDAGLGYELDVIAAAVVGGASLTGGRGTALGTVFGAILIKMIDQGIVILKIDQNYSRIIIGAVIILAVALDQLNQWYSQKRLAHAAANT
jgi:ribose transport system permease protein